MQVHSSASGVSILELIISLALCFCIVFHPGANQSASEKEVMQGAALSPLQMLEFLREAVKRLAKQDYNWANNPNNPRLQRWLGNLKRRLLMVEPTLNTGLDLLIWVTHTNPHLKAFIWHKALFSLLQLSNCFVSRVQYSLYQKLFLSKRSWTGSLRIRQLGSAPYTTLFTILARPASRRKKWKFMHFFSQAALILLNPLQNQLGFDRKCNFLLIKSMVVYRREVSKI